MGSGGNGKGPRDGGSGRLRRELGLVGATMMGLGSIVGTGIFVSVGVAAGPAVILAVVLAAGLTTCNAFSSAQLAANHPMSGGTYEYGYEFLNPAAGFTAGWMFLCAKSASAATATLGVMLNLILGLSRVMLAMGRRGDLPRATARLDPEGRTPPVAVLVTGGVVAGLAAIGDVETTWSFSAFTVLVYYALTNLAALRLTERQRLFSRFFPRAGLAGCLFLAFWVRPAVWLAGLGLIAAGLVWHRTRRT